MSLFTWGEPTHPRSYQRPVRMADYFRSVGRMPAIREGDKRYWSEHSWRRAPIEWVRLDQLHAAQTWISVAGLRHHARKDARPDGGELPCVVHYRGRFYLVDGHHRAITAIDRGETRFRARVKRPETDPTARKAQR